jgi:hypothetical protein
MSAVPANDHAAVRLLRRFFAEMNAWEWEMIGEDFSDLEDLEPDAIDAEVDKRRLKQRKRLAKIFDKYCEAGSDARRVHDVLHCGGEEPDYNPRTEKVLSVEARGDKVIIETKMAHNFKFRLKYELVKVGRTWRIRDNRKCKNESLPNPKWSRWDL